jgi:hypothetical protein
MARFFLFVGDMNEFKKIKKNIRRNFEISSNLSVIVEKVLKMTVFGTSRLKNFNSNI